MPRKRVGIRRKLKGLDSRDSVGPVVPMLAIDIQECGRNHIRATRTNGPHQSFKSVLAAPQRESLLRRFRETEVEDSPCVFLVEPIQFHAKNMGRGFHFSGSQNPERRAEFGANAVLTTFSPNAAGIGDARTIAFRQPDEEP